MQLPDHQIIQVADSRLRRNVNIRRMRRFMLALAIVVAGGAAAAQQTADLPIARPIDPGGVMLPAESDSARETKFSFIAYGDTRGQADGDELQFEHGRI